MTDDHAGARADQSISSKDSTFVSHIVHDLSPFASHAPSQDLNVQAMSDDEVRERFKAMIVSDSNGKSDRE